MATAQCRDMPFTQRKNIRLKGKPSDMAIIPHVQMVSGKISRLQAKYNIKTIYQLANKSNNMLRSAKDKLGCNVPGIYHIPREGKVYVGQTGHTITARCKEHECHI
jgi:hypothetical protein